MRNDLNKSCSVKDSGRFETKQIVQECLTAFPYVWASLSKLFVYGTWLMKRVVTRLLVGKYQSLITHYGLADLTMLVTLLYSL